jgi:hypothetical protein
MEITFDDIDMTVWLDAVKGYLPGQAQVNLGTQNCMFDNTATTGLHAVMSTAGVERVVMVAWKPSHMQSLRLQFTTQRDAVGFENPAKRSVQLQYVLAFGAHGAHAY